MSQITKPVILDETGREIVRAIKTLNVGFWAEKEKHIPTKDVNFYDCDGTVLYAYTAAEFLALSEMPANPARDGLTAQGWNSTLSNAQTYVGKYGVCEIGQMYVTDDGKTRAVIDVGEPERLTAKLKFTQSAASVVTVDWGDGSQTETASAVQAALTHTYAAAGRYTITLEAAENTTYQIGNNGTFQGGFIGMGDNFTGRSILKELYIGAGVTAIPPQGLWMQTNLEILTIPQGVTTIGARSLESMISLRALVLPRGVMALGDYVCRTDYNMEVLCLPDTVTDIGSGFQTCVNLKRVTVPEGVTAIKQQAFIRCFSAEVIQVPDTVTTFGSGAFESCYALVALNIPDGVTAIPNSLCRACHSLRLTELPEGVTSIGQMAFSACFGFENFTIPSTVTSIGKFAFLFNDGASSITMLSTTPPTLEPTAFWDTILVAIYVPYSADHSVLNAYLAATGWSSLGDKIVEVAAS